MADFPVIASILSEDKLGEFIRDAYNLTEDFQCKLFRTGINHTYMMANKNNKFVVRVYCYNWRTPSEIKEELNLLQLLKEHHLSVSVPIPDKENKLIQTINAPEGVRYAVLFSHAEGEKMRFMDNETCFEMGALMAKFHTITSNKRIHRTNYTSEILLHKSYQFLTRFFSEDLSEMKYLKKTALEIAKTFHEIEPTEFQTGIVHLDIWYDNVSVNNKQEITIFDFDNCGNGFLFLDIGYFLMQLFHIEVNKEIYESKVGSFLNGYQKVRALSAKEIELIPEAGAAIYTFYLGVQAQRFDWSNIFLTENYLKMFVGRIQTWKEYYDLK